VRRETLVDSLTVRAAGPGTADRVLRWPDGSLTLFERGSWGAADGARFELRRAGGSTLDV
jgi:hypothetical protein